MIGKWFFYGGCELSAAMNPDRPTDTELWPINQGNALDKSTFYSILCALLCVISLFKVELEP